VGKKARREATDEYLDRRTKTPRKKSANFKYDAVGAGSTGDESALGLFRSTRWWDHALQPDAHDEP